MNCIRAGVVAALLCTVTAAPVVAAELGRLFLTPQQRDDLDRRRTSNIQDAVVTTVSRVTVEGQVSRSSGKDTVWLNGAPQYDGPRARDPARVVVPRSEQEGSVSVKVGETLDRVSGEITNGLEGGTIVIRPSRTRNVR
jgi:hypothetical protein